MAKVTIGGILGGIILLIALGTLPNESVTDTRSTVQNAGESYTTDKVIDSSEQMINIVGEQSVQNACENLDSSLCSTAKNTFSTTSLAWVILLVGLLVEGLVGFSKWIIRSVEFFLDLVN